jgi:hypothetical protein
VSLAEALRARVGVLAMVITSGPLEELHHVKDRRDFEHVRDGALFGVHKDRDPILSFRSLQRNRRSDQDARCAYGQTS